MTRPLTFVSLFAGIGGFDAGFENAGMTCLGQVEIDKNAQNILTHHWPEVPKHDDVQTATQWADDIGLVGRVDVVCGGFPCQDVSVAGKRAGLAGARTGLFWDALAFATHIKARWIVLENVPGLLSSNQGRDFGVVLAALADAGYSHLEWRVVDSQFHGVPQRRRRVIIVGCTASPRGRAVLIEPESGVGDPAPSVPAGQEVAGTLGGGSGSRGWSSDTDRMTFVPYTPTGIAQYGEGVGTLRSHGGDIGGGRETIVTREEDQGQGVLKEDGSWYLPVVGTLTTAFGEKNYSNHQEVSQGSILVQPATAIDLRNGTTDETAMPVQAGGMGADRGMSINSVPHVMEGFRASSHGTFAEGVGPISARYGKDGKDDLIVDPELFRMQAFGQYDGDGTASAMKARDWKDATDLIVEV